MSAPKNIFCILLPFEDLELYERYTSTLLLMLA